MPSSVIGRRSSGSMTLASAERASAASSSDICVRVYGPAPPDLAALVRGAGQRTGRRRKNRRHGVTGGGGQRIERRGCRRRGGLNRRGRSRGCRVGDGSGTG